MVHAQKASLLMVVVFRDRIRYRTPHVGTLIHLPTDTPFVQETPAGFGRCEDVIGRFPLPNPLSIEKWGHHPLSMTGMEPSFPVYEFKNYPCTNQPAAGHASDLAGMPIQSDAEAATAVMAWTTPGRPEISIPNFLAELRDVPRMLSQQGRKKSRGGNSVAETNFGWNALFADAVKLFDFPSQVEKRRKELEASFTTGLHRSRVVADQEITSTESNVTFQSFGVYLEGERKRITHRRKWVSMVWRAEDPSIIPRNFAGERDFTPEARRLVHGWHNAPARVWNALPWSWLIDYFVNVGDFLEASGNALGIRPTEVCIMLQTDTNITDVPYSSPSWLQISGGYSSYSTKSRTLWGDAPSLAFKVPIISEQQLVTLVGIGANYGPGIN